MVHILTINTGIINSMTFLLRISLVGALVSNVVFTSHAQSEAPVATPTTPPTSAEVAATTLAPLLAPKQLQEARYKEGKYRDYLIKRYPNDKEARAVIHLFSRKQRGGFLWLTAGAATIGLITTQTGTKTNDSGVTTTFEVTPLGYGILVGLFGGVGIGKLARFSDEKLYLATTKAKHFQVLW